MDFDHECVFPEEREPDGRLILTPCLECNTPAIEAIKNGIELETKLSQAQKEIERLKKGIATREFEKEKWRKRYKNLKGAELMDEQISTLQALIKTAREALEKMSCRSGEHGEYSGVEFLCCIAKEALRLLREGEGK